MPKKKFKPFEHDDLELKNQLIDYAREIKDKEEIEAQLACAMIYSSFAEYMSGHLLENLRHLMYQTTYREFAAILYVDHRTKKKEKPRTMGQTLALLESYGFPDKRDIMELLRDISKSRNNLFHNFAKADAKGLEVLGEDIENIKGKTEELFSKINVVYAGLQKILMDPEGASGLEDKK